MARPKKDRSANALRPRARDLFGFVPVTIDEEYEWVKKVAPHISHAPWRVENYIKGYRVAEKIQAAKLSGEFWKIV